MLMKNVLLGFMTFLMLMPIMACGMAFCPMRAAQAAVSEKMPCHQSNDTQKSGPMLVLDCMGVDLFQENTQLDSKISSPDLSLEKLVFFWADTPSNNDFILASSHSIRGPPTDTSPPHAHSHNIYLTTQRLRI